MLESEGEAPLQPVLPFNQCLKEEIKVQKAIIGKKIGMTQIFDETGKVIPVTVIEAGPCTVVQKKTAEKDGYDSVQLGFCDANEKKLTKPAKLLEEGSYVYFVHSFYAENCEASLAAVTDYGIPITAAVEQGNIFGCQFHPEKSGNVGLAILKKFCEV